MRSVEHPFVRCMQCEGRAISPRRLCPSCEIEEAMTKASIKGRCSYCKEITLLTKYNLEQGHDGKYTLICEDCEERR